jgi:cellulose synthase/poly-beta-1,6-N-acetylglucosamine synthase-like glycosyltransferase
MDIYEITLIFNSTGIAFFTVNTWIGLTILISGYTQLAFYLILSQVYEYRKRNLKMRHKKTYLPKVSVLISAFNEEKVIETCVRSILASQYAPIEVVIVDDGSTDSTLDILNKLAKTMKIIVVHKKNGGKAKGLNTALKIATGSIIITMDADTSLSPLAIRKMVEHFSDPKVGAVCGYDIPSNANNWLVKLLMLSSHVSTGLVRRSLSIIDCIMVVNFGAFRADVLRKAGEYAKTIGEDFEMTLRIHKLGYKIDFEPEAIAKSESPSSLRVLWNQRIRWFRGYLHGIRMHKDMLFRSKFGLFLAYNFIANVIFPWFLFIAFFIFIVAVLTIQGFGATLAINMLYLTVSFFGLIPSFLVVCYSLWLDRNFNKYSSFLVVFPMWIVYSLFLDMVCMKAMILELTGKERKWNPWVKTGIVTKSL